MTSEPAYPPPARAWWLVVLLFLASIISVIDRSILSIVVDPVKADLALSDVQIGLLQGLAFGLFYATAGLPLGLIADRASRRNLLCGGILVWSLATIAAGLAPSFAPLFVSRLLVGLGEAALGPAAISLIADLFPPDRRGKPLGLAAIGQALAGGIAFSVTSLIVARAAAGVFRGVPLLAALHPWRIAFVCSGAAGLVIVAALLTAREPPRRASRPASGLGAQARGSLAYFARNPGVFVPLYLGFAACFFAAYGAGAWAPAMLHRQFAATNAQIGAVLGPLAMLFAITGPLLGGVLIDRCARGGNHMAKLAILMIAPLAAIPAALAVLAPGPLSAIVLVASSSGVFAVIGTTMFALLQLIVPSDMRGLAIALTGLVNTVLAASLAPLLIAALTEHVFRDPARVGVSILCVALPALLLGSALFAMARGALAAQCRSQGEAGLIMAASSGP